MKKRVLSILLLLCMALTMLPAPGLGEEAANPSAQEALACVCEAACTEGSLNGECPVCGAQGATAEVCALYREPEQNGEAEPDMPAADDIASVKIALRCDNEICKFHNSPATVDLVAAGIAFNLRDGVHKDGQGRYYVELDPPATSDVKRRYMCYMDPFRYPHSCTWGESDDLRLYYDQNADGTGVWKTLDAELPIHCDAIAPPKQPTYAELSSLDNKVTIKCLEDIGTEHGLTFELEQNYVIGGVQFDEVDGYYVDVTIDGEKLLAEKLNTAERLGSGFPRHYLVSVEVPGGPIRYYYDDYRGTWSTRYGQDAITICVTCVYTLTFDASGGTGAPEAMKSETDSFVIPETVPTRDGWHFAGWAVTDSSNDAQYQPGVAVDIAAINKLTGNTGDTSATLYAVWKRHGDFYEPKDGFCDLCGGCLHEKDADGYCTADGCTHNAKGYDCCPLRDTRIVLTRDQSMTTQIQKSYDGTTKGYLREITYLDGTNEVVLTDWEERANCTIEAVYDTPNVGNGKTVTVTVTLSDEMAKQYVFQNGTTVDTFTITGSIEKRIPPLSIGWTKTEFLVGELLLPSFRLIGVMENAEVTYRYAAHPMFITSEHIESNPKIDENTAITEAGDYWVYAMTTETENFKASYTSPVKITVRDYCTVTFNPNGGYVRPEEGTRKVAWGQKYGELPVPTREGYDFDGWYMAAEGGSQIYKTDRMPENTKEQTLYAHWNEHGTDMDGDGFCDFCDECVHEKDEQGCCIVTGCTHSADGLPCCPKRTLITPVLTPPTVEGTFYAFDSYGALKAGLTGGEATVDGMKIEGTFAFDENEELYGFPPFDDQTLRGGKLTRTVIFTPADPTTFASARCTVTVTVHKLTVDEIWGTYIDITDKKIGTPFSELGLSDDLSFFALRGGVRCDSTYQGAVVWNESDYDPNEPHEQTITGTLAIIEEWKDNFEEPNPPIKTSVKVKLQYDPVTPTIVTPPVFRWSKGDFRLADNRIFVGDYLETGTTKTLGEEDETAELVGGEARLNGQKINGTFKLVSPSPKWTEHVGTYTVKVIFTPEDTVLYAQAECTIHIEAIKRTVARVDYLPKSVTDKPVGTAFEDLEMFGLTSFWTEDGSYYSGINVTWDKDTYNPNSEEEQIVTGTLDLKYISEYVQQPDPELKAEVRVKLLHAHAFTQKIQKPEALKTPADCLSDAVYYLSCACGEVSANEADTFTAEGTALSHAWAAWTQNGDGKTHTRVCTRDASHTETGDCHGGQATCTAQAVCEDCKAVYGELAAHSYGAEWKTNRYQHWHECTVCSAMSEGMNHSDRDDDHLCDTCGKKMTEHDFTAEKAEEKYLKAAATCQSPAVYCKSCTICGAQGTETFEQGDRNPDNHTGTLGDWQHDADSHWKVYSCCQAEALKAAHAGGQATCTAQAVCEDCGAAYGKPLDHDWPETWSRDADSHWHECARCHEKKDIAAHDFGEGDVCAICGYERAHVHRLTLVQALEATCTADGHTAYYTCSGCSAWFADATGAVEIADKNAVIIPATGHAFGSWQSDADEHWKTCGKCSLEADRAAHSFETVVDRSAAEGVKGEQHEECAVCGYRKEPTEIPALPIAITRVDAKVTAPALGERASFTAAITVQPEGSARLESVSWFMIPADQFTGQTGDRWAAMPEEDAPVFRAGYYYAVELYAGANDGYAFADSVVKTVNGQPHDTTYSGNENETNAYLALVFAPLTEHTHAFGSWRFDATSHWRECACGEQADKAAHTESGWIIDREATETEAGSRHTECTVCGRVLRTEEIPATGHAFGDWQSDETDHWRECACGEQADKASHTESGWIIDREATETEAGSRHTECTVCGRVLRTEAIPATGHMFGSAWHSDETNHWHECAACGAKTDKAAHTESNWIIDRSATETEAGSRHTECTVCGRVLRTEAIPATGHAFGDWQSDETDHWRECATCGEQADKAAHEFKWVIDRRPTATQKGSRHEECIICGHQRAAVEIPATGASDVPKTGDRGYGALGYTLLAGVLGLLGAACLGKKKRVR